MSHIFVSYSREDRDPVRYIVKYLKEEGFGVWFDEDLSASSRHDFLRDIEAALQESAVVLVCWSDNAAKSTYVLAEALRGIQYEKLLQINMDGTTLPIPFNGRHFIDFSNWRGFSSRWVDCVLYGPEDPIQRLFRAILDVLHRRRAEPLEHQYGKFVAALAESLLSGIEEVETLFSLQGIKRSEDGESSWNLRQFCEYRWEILGLLDGIGIAIPKKEREKLSALAASYERGDSSAEKTVWHSQQSLRLIEEAAQALVDRSRAVLEALNHAIAQQQMTRVADQ